MATVKCLVSLDTFRSKYYSDSAHGTRTYFILGSVAGSSHDGDVVPRRALNLTDEDRRILTNLGLPPDRWTDLEVLLARIKQVKERTLLVKQSAHQITNCPANTY